MKAIPILFVTNVVTLCALALLWVEQQDLGERLDRGRASVPRGASARDPLDPALLEDIERRLSDLEGAPGAPFSGPGGAPAGGGAAGTPPSASPGDPGSTPPGGGAAPAGDWDPAEMDAFRAKVARAQELNREEEQIRRIVGRLDQMIESGRLGSLSRGHKDRAARVLLRYQQRTPTIWRTVMSRPENRQLSWPERRELVSAEFDKLREEAKTELTAFLPQPDAEAIAQESIGFRSGMRSAVRGAAGR